MLVQLGAITRYQKLATLKQQLVFLLMSEEYLNRQITIIVLANHILKPYIMQQQRMLNAHGIKFSIMIQYRWKESSRQTRIGIIRHKYRLELTTRCCRMRIMLKRVLTNLRIGGWLRATRGRSSTRMSSFQDCCLRISHLVKSLIMWMGSLQLRHMAKITDIWAFCLM
jgi:hypothetical protein